MYTATTTGDLNINASGYSAGQYKLTALDFGADDFDADAATAGMLSASRSIEASLANPIDRAAFQVTLQAGKF